MVRTRGFLTMAVNFHDDHGIRFEYPPTWEIDVSDDGPRILVTVQSPSGPAFALITIDADRPSPKEVVGEALVALQEEYPQLEAAASDETIDGHATVGLDIDFMTLDMTNSCAIRCFRTPRRTVFVLAQWSDADEGDPEELLRSVRRSFEETDS
jgi:hypothetical protein